MLTLKFHNLAGERGGHILFGNLDLTLTSGQMCHIRGANGAGKTTLLRIIAGLLPAMDGFVSLNEMRDKNAISAQCSYLSTQNAMKQALNVADNLSFWAHFYGTHKQLTHIMERLELTPLAHIAYDKLSSGQKRRVAFARILLEQRSIWILDEPINALDRENRHLFNQLLQQHLQQNGIIIAASHIAFECPIDIDLDLETYQIVGMV